MQDLNKELRAVYDAYRAECREIFAKHQKRRENLNRLFSRKVVAKNEAQKAKKEKEDFAALKEKFELETRGAQKVAKRKRR